MPAFESVGQPTSLNVAQNLYTCEKPVNGISILIRGADGGRADRMDINHIRRHTVAFIKTRFQATVDFPRLAFLLMVSQNGIVGVSNYQTQFSREMLFWP